MAEKAAGSESDPNRWSKPAPFGAGDAAMNSVIIPAEPLKPSLSNSRVPAHLYKRDGLYYFRVVISDKFRQRLDRSELRISLRTAYRRNALALSSRLHVFFYELLESDPMLTYKEIKRRLNIYLQRQLEADHDNISLPPSVEDSLILAADQPGYTRADLYRSFADSIQEMVNDPTPSKRYIGIIKNMLIECGIFWAAEFNKKDTLRIFKAYLQSQVTYYQLLEKKCRGDYLAEDVIVSGDFGELPPPPPNLQEEFIELLREGEARLAEKAAREKAIAEESKRGSLPQIKSSMLYSEAVQVFIKNKLDENQWKAHMVPEHEGQLKSFLDIMGDMTIDKIDRAIMRSYRGILAKLPPNHTRAAEYKGKTIDEIMDMSPKKVLSPTRVNIMVQAVSSLLDWFVNEGVIPNNPATKLQQKEERQAIDLRSPFEKNDLGIIFSHPKFTEGKFKFADYFWPPLIALFSGMRLEEICQLHCQDVYEINGIWVIDINNKGRDEGGHGKTLKNVNASRLVPVHKTLIDLGFLLYKNHISGQNHIRLFPNLNKSDQVGKYGKQVGKQFNDLVKIALKKPDYNSEGKSFHSLRHNFADFYKQRGLQTDVFRQLYGHDIPELAARQYGSKFPPELLNEVISALDYDLDFSFLKKSKYIKEVTANSGQV